MDRTALHTSVQRILQSMTGDFPTEHDIETAAETFRTEIEDAEEYDGPVIAVLSCGYVQIWQDGEVTGPFDSSFRVDSDGRVED